MTDEQTNELAQSTRRYVIQFLTNFDRHIIEIGPDEAFTEFLCNYGNTWSRTLMSRIIPTGVFSSAELGILNKIESYIFKILSEHSDASSWNNIKKENYLEIKSLTYDYLRLVYDLNYE